MWASVAPTEGKLLGATASNCARGRASAATNIRAVAHDPYPNNSRDSLIVISILWVRPRLSLTRRASFPIESMVTDRENE
jgi:hypothetical protein